MGLEPTSGLTPPPVFKTGPSSGRMTSVRLEPSSGGWNRTSGLHVQSAASLPAATAPEFGKEDSNLHRLIQSQASLPLADSRERPAGVEPACPAWKTGASDRSAKDANRRCGSGRRGSRTLKAHRSPGFEPGAVAHRLALPHRRAPAAGIEPASSRLTAGRSYQHELHRNRRVRQSGWPDSNRRSPAPEAGGLPGFPTSRVARHRQVPSGSRTRTSAMARR